ncbi:MAG TPA: YopX family protein [Bacteroidia bacterium]|nr:YopX family protein [Bacteroidia bacterium]
MEDRYLFKAKRIDNGEWVTGHYVKGLNMYGKEVHLIFEPNTMFYSSGETDGWYKVDPTTICQCTGLKDKNGKLIWENDIVRDIYGNFYAVFYQNNYYRFSWICVKSDVFLIGAKWHLWDINSLEVEVIGNIFDNKELLESEE